jgi:hypothetical protein
MSLPFMQPYMGLGNSLQTAQGGAGGGVSAGGWVELGRHVLGSTASEVFVDSLPDKRYYMVLYEDKGEASAQARLLRYNSDSGSNYANRVSTNGASDTTQNTQTQHNGFNGNNTTPQFNVWYIANLAGKEKLLTSQGVMQSNPPARVEYAGKWANTSDAINRIGVIQNAGVHGVGTTITVLGWDPADTHTSNFWEELASDDWVSGTSLPTVSFTAKKYLWVQFFTSGGIGGDGANRVSVRVGNGSVDTGSNYAFRNSENGGTDSTETSTDRFLTHTGNKKNFTNMFIVNNSANEKLAMYHTSEGSGTGASSATSRIEGVGKWSNTSSQINRISVFDYTGGNSFNAGTIKVWGSD